MSAEAYLKRAAGKSTCESAVARRKASVCNTDYNVAAAVLGFLYCINGNVACAHICEERADAGKLTVMVRLAYPYRRKRKAVGCGST